LTGCAGNSKNVNPVDPYEKANRFLYNVNEDLDRWALKPISDAYLKFVPTFLRVCLGNAFDNLTYGDVILNDFLQGEARQGVGDLGRMALNSTLGIGGLFDVATDLHLPAHQTDFGLTLAQWGVKPGPYLFIPVFGPSTVRDCTRYGVAVLDDPITWIDAPWAATIPLSFTYIIDTRSRYGAELRFRSETAIDPYVFTRTAYLQYREGLTHPGKTSPPPDQDLYDVDDDTSSTTQPASQATTQGGKR
jgi:phospholipid-binding lipoprotein MlaA